MDSKQVTRYEVRYTCYQYNDGVSRNGDYRCKSTFTDPLTAIQYGDYVQSSVLKRQPDWDDDARVARSKQIADEVYRSFVNDYDGVYEVVVYERPITLESIADRTGLEPQIGGESRGS